MSGIRVPTAQVHVVPAGAVPETAHDQHASFTVGSNVVLAGTVSVITTPVAVVVPMLVAVSVYEIFVDTAACVVSETLVI